MRRLTLFIGCMLFASGCGLLGDESDPLRRVREGGTGPFRSLDANDTGLSATPEGRIGVDMAQSAPGWGERTVDRMAWNEAGCFASLALRTEPVPARDPGAPAGEPDPLQFEPTAIVRCDANEGAIVTSLRDVVLTPTEAWEGEDLRDPWPLRLSNGTIHLYYAAEGGIGLATASSPDGPFMRVGTAPIIAPIDVASPLRSPTVVPAPGGTGYLMYFDDGARIFVARSDDGLAFTIVDTDTATAAIDPISLPPIIEGETIDVHPGAITVTVSEGRQIVRLYFDAPTAEDDNVCMAGSFDGIVFERFVPASYVSEGVAFPVPRLLPTGETVLTLTRFVNVMSVVVRVPVGAVAPTFAEFDAGME